MAFGGVEVWGDGLVLLFGGDWEVEISGLMVRGKGFFGGLHGLLHGNTCFILFPTNDPM